MNAQNHTDPEWIFGDFKAALLQFCRNMADKLGVHVDGTTLVTKTASPNFRVYAPLAFICNDRDLDDLLELLAGKGKEPALAGSGSVERGDWHNRLFNLLKKVLHKEMASKEPWKSIREALNHCKTKGEPLKCGQSDGNRIANEAADSIYNNVILPFVELRESRLKLKQKIDSLVKEFEELRPKSGDVGDTEATLIKVMGYLKAAQQNVPVEPPLRLPEYYHEITEPNLHLKQHYYRLQYLPPSHPERAPMDNLNGCDRHRDDFIQRPSQKKRILASNVRFLYHHMDQPKKGAFPLLNFEYLKPLRTRRHRIGIRKSQFVHVQAQHNYQIESFMRLARNFKLTSNRTADMFLAREFGVRYTTMRVM